MFSKFVTTKTLDVVDLRECLEIEIIEISGITNKVKKKRFANAVEFAYICNFL